MDRYSIANGKKPPPGVYPIEKDPDTFFMGVDIGIYGERAGVFIGHLEESFLGNKFVMDQSFVLPGDDIPFNQIVKYVNDVYYDYHKRNQKLSLRMTETPESSGILIIPKTDFVKCTPAWVSEIFYKSVVYRIGNFQSILKKFSEDGEDESSIIALSLAIDFLESKNIPKLHPCYV